MDPLRIGVLGAARISERAIVTPARLAGARIVAVAARDRTRAERFASAHGIERVSDSYADLLADPDVEAVYNPLPNGLHGPWNLAAIAAGKHVLSEKPFASNAAEAAEVRDAGKRTGLVVAEGFHYVHHPVTRRLHALLDAGELGDLKRVEVRVVITPLPLEDPRWSLSLAGGALMDLGCYSLHAHRMLAPWAGGEPSIVDARGAEHPERPGVDEWADITLRFPSGATGGAACHMAGQATEMTYRVVGSGGEALIPNFVLPQLDDRIVVTTAAGTRVEHLGIRSSYTYQLDAFIAAVREGAPMPTDSDDAVATMCLVDASYRALGMEPRPRSAAAP